MISFGLHRDAQGFRHSHTYGTHPRLQYRALKVGRGWQTRWIVDVKIGDGIWDEVGSERHYSGALRLAERHLNKVLEDRVLAVRRVL